MRSGRVAGVAGALFAPPALSRFVVVPVGVRVCSAMDVGIWAVTSLATVPCVFFPETRRCCARCCAVCRKKPEGGNVDPDHAMKLSDVGVERPPHMGRNGAGDQARNKRAISIALRVLLCVALGYALALALLVAYIAAAGSRCVPALARCRCCHPPPLLPSPAVPVLVPCICTARGLCVPLARAMRAQLWRGSGLCALTAARVQTCRERSLPHAASTASLLTCILVPQSRVRTRVGHRVCCRLHGPHLLRLRHNVRDSPQGAAWPSDVPARNAGTFARLPHSGAVVWPGW